MKIRYFFAYIVVATFLVACGNDDNNYSSDLNTIDNYFAVPDDAMDTESVIRREFYISTSVHILFNDTLRVVNYGVNRFGNEIIYANLLDPGYSFTAHTNKYYSFDYIPESRMTAAAEFIENDVLGTFDKSLYPYSIMLAERIDSYKAEYDSQYYVLEDSDIQFHKSYRCMLICIRDLATMTSNERAARAKEIIASVAAVGVGTLDESLFTDFFKWAEGYYSAFSWEGSGAMYDLGFLGHNDYYGFVEWYSKSDDISSYVEKALMMSEAEFMATYGSYEACVAKYNFIKDLLLNLGFTL